MKTDQELEELGDLLERSAAADLRSEQSASRAAGRWVRRRRSRLLASSSLGLAGIGAAAVIVLSGTAATPPAFAITQHDDGSILVVLNDQEDLGQANQKLSAMGIHEQITLASNPQPTAYRGPENCSAGPGVGKPHPAIQLEVNTNDADNTGVTGAVRCVLEPGTYRDAYGVFNRDLENSRTVTSRSASAG